MLRDWPLVGRDGELARLAAAVRRPDRAGVVIAGPAGVGKTRLLRECLDQGRAHGFAVVRVAGSAVATDIPFGALAALLPPGATTGGGAAALAGARVVLRDLAGERPLLFAVDDAQLLDDASALLVYQLASELTGFVALTVRQGETLPDPIAALWRDDLVERIDLGALERTAQGDLLAAVLEGPVDPSTEALLWERSAGNALYLRELVVGSVHAGTLGAVDGHWRLARHASLPARLVEVVEERLRHLDADQRHALRLVAFGEPIGVELLERAVGSAVLVELERLGLLDVSEDGKRLTARLSHPLHGEVLRHEASRLEARACRRTLADLIDGTGARRREDLLRLAVWRLEAGGSIRVEQLVEAAAAAREAGDVELGERLARTAVDQGGGFAAALELGRCRYESGDHAGARAVLDPLVDEAADDRQRVALAMVRTDIAFWGQGRLAEAQAILRDAVATVDRRAHGLLHALGSMADAHAGMVARALEAANPLLADRTPAGQQAVVAAAVVLSAAGRIGEALALTDTVLSADGAAPMMRISAMHARAVALADAGRVGESEAVATDSYQQASRLGDTTFRGYSASSIGYALVNRGRLESARRIYKEAAALFAIADQPAGRRWALVGELLAAAQARADDAPSLVDALDALPPHDGRLFEGHERRGRAWVLANAGQRAAARQALVEAAQWCEGRGQHGYALYALHDLGRLGWYELEWAERLAAACDGALLETMADHLIALARNDAGGLVKVSDAFADLGVDLLAAEAASSARDALARAGQQRPAARWAERSRELAARCQGASTPALSLVEVAVPLTRREREVASLVASGLTSRAVADQLFLSVRTVESHLARAYDKLGVSSRAELAEVLGA